MNKLIIILIFSLSFVGCAIMPNSIEKHNEFAIKSAKIGLWNEAIMRWKRIVEANPNDAKIHNNLAVAYEAKGDMESAMLEYNKAMKLDPKNRVYSNNYTRFKQNYDKLHKKDTKIQDFEQKT
jgi:tetratricopeptide (TPR) repeat protein